MRFPKDAPPTVTVTVRRAEFSVLERFVKNYRSDH